ncbi:MAG: protease SohB [Gammaproteobacteria bacterium]|jgi:serine protease SohB|nr:protease SohB [Gammaproteobacteria bacterium]
MEFILEYGMFLAKFGTVLLAVIALIVVVLVFLLKAKGGGDDHLDIKNINHKFEHMQLMLESAIFSKKEFKQSVKDVKAKHKKEEKKSDEADERRRLFVLDFKGDIRATEVASLREEISSLLTVCRKNDEVVVLVESGGGTVHGYGLAASQLKRIRDKNIKLTVSVDKVAASGGYMMACVADHIIAAPFAILGSIGVLAQIPNFNKLLKKHDIDFEQIAAGKYKRTLTMFGENTDADREKLKEELEETHILFKAFVKENRDKVDIEKIATGEHWYGKQALELGLIDEIRTSDDYLGSATANADVYEIEYVRKKPFIEKIFSSTVKLFQQDPF